MILAGILEHEPPKEAERGKDETVPVLWWHM